MKKTYLKFLFSIMLIFSFFVLTNTYFCATATLNDKYYFEKPDSWTGSKVYINLIDSSTGTKAFPEPGAEISPILNKFKIDNVFELNGDLYRLSMNEEIASKGNFDKIVFSNGNDSQNIINQTNQVDIVSRTIYKVTGGSGTSQEITATNPFNISVATKIQKFYGDLQTKNKGIAQYIIDDLNTVVLTLQKILANNSSYKLMEELLMPLDEIDKYLTKEDGLYDELIKKIEEAKDIIKDDGYTQDGITKLEDAITNGEYIRDNYDYYSNDQVKNVIKEIDDAIKNLIPDTSKLEETLENAKNIDKEKYTDETAKELSDAITNAEEALKDKSNLTINDVNDLTNALNDAISKLVEKTITTENTNPATGDILYVIIPVLIVAILAILFTVVYSKKKKQTQSK